MGKYIKELAEMFNDRNNPSWIGITIGEILSVDPMEIKYGDNIILRDKHLVIADSLLNGYKVEYIDDNGTNEIKRSLTIKNKLVAGDKVIMVASNSNQTFFVIDKVG